MCSIKHVLFTLQPTYFLFSTDEILITLSALKVHFATDSVWIINFIRYKAVNQDACCCNKHLNPGIMLGEVGESSEAVTLYKYAMPSRRISLMSDK